MKKMWIKKENMYRKPIYKQKVKLVFIILVLMGFIFFAHQFIYMSELTASSVINITLTTPKQGLQIKDSTQIVRGIRLIDSHLYTNNQNGYFTCIQSGKQIKFDRINDDYCDCIEDGSDEPSTNACSRGVFYCNLGNRQIVHRLLMPVSIPSSRINDGICDCCDGSDEWLSGKDCKNFCY